MKDLLGGTTKEMMEAEMDDHLGYEKSERTNDDSEAHNYRNGYNSKRVNSSYGSMDIDVPQDRNSSFEPKIVRKRQKDISDIDQKFISISPYGRTVSFTRSPQYPYAMKRWYENWDAVSPIFKFSADVRKAFYTTNAIESLNATLRRLNRQETANLFTNELEFKGERLGDADKPDIIVYHDANGTIIDNKSYKDGFSVDKHCADEMHRYIVHNRNRKPGVPKNEWWKKFGSGVSNFTFLFITSKLVGNYKKNLEELSANSGINGGAIGIDSLLYLSDKIKSNSMSYDSFFDLMKNDEIVITA